MNMPFDDQSHESDDALLARFATGDRAAAQILTLRLTPIALAHAYRILGDQAEAEDVTQEALLRLWRLAKDWETGRAKVTTWLYRVVSNLCVDRLRKRRPVDLDNLPDPADDAPGADAVILQQSRADALQDALTKLPLRQQQAVILRHLEGLSNPDIAEIMGLRVEAVESLTARGKRALATALVGRQKELGYQDD